MLLDGILTKYTVFVRKNRDGRAPEWVKLSTEYEEKGSVEAEGFYDLLLKLREKSEDLPVTDLSIGDVVRVGKDLHYIFTEYRFALVSVC